jgi:hypothetical protein
MSLVFLLPIMCKWIRYRSRNNSTKWQSLFSIWKATSSIEWNWGIFLTECSPWDDTRRFSRGLHLTYIISCCWLTAVSVLLCTNNNNSWVLIVKQDWDYICCQWYTAKEFPLEISPWRPFHILCPMSLDVSMACAINSHSLTFYFSYLFT